MVKLNLRKRKNWEEEILEDVDLTAIVEQKRRQQGSVIESGSKLSDKQKVEDFEGQHRIITSEQTSIDELFPEDFVEWLVEKALRDEDRYKRLMENIDKLNIDDLRRLCKLLLKKLKEGS
ncbi:MAG: hypothetical protein GXO26_04730 [Crenarchaeota archaeon]|nr:hypothetical protein [Thermoproteota archaeon]